MTSDHGIWILRKAGRLAGLAFRTTVLVQVTAAHAGRFHFDHDLVRAWRGVGKLHQFQFAATGEHHTTHGSLLSGSPGGYPVPPPLATVACSDCSTWCSIPATMNR